MGRRGRLESVATSTRPPSVSDVVRFIGPPPVPATDSFRDALEAEGADPDNVVAQFVFEEQVSLAANTDTANPDAD